MNDNESQVTSDGSISIMECMPSPGQAKAAQKKQEQTITETTSEAAIAH